MRELDRLAIEQIGIPGLELMQRAGHAAFRALTCQWPEARSISVLCGGGNNAGDGYVVATLALAAGWSVQLIALKTPDQLKGDAARAARAFLERGGQCSSLSDECLNNPESGLAGEVLVDALLGTGLDRPPEGDYARLIEAINASPRPVLALDLPSGLDIDRGAVPGAAIRADLTVTFIGRKRGLYTGAGPDHCGRIRFEGLDLPDRLSESMSTDTWLMQAAQLQDWLRPRRSSTHKGDLGHVLVMGGDQGMAGAPILTGQAALRAGSGLVSLATRAEHAAATLAAQPELMSHAAEDLSALDGLIERADVLALGPGLGQSDWSKALWLKAMQSGRPLVVDADGLNLLALQALGAERLILTPHPGEAARLLGLSVAEIQSDRFAAAGALAERFGATVVLKGPGSLIASTNGEIALCAYGNPAMATAGMGDALTGIIASLVGQGLSDFDAAGCGVLAHALAGDRAARNRRQILASDLIAALGRVLPA